MRIAGRRIRMYSMLKHTGRVSGREYRNPVSAYPLGDGFVIAVLYGSESQWIKNVTATKKFTLRTKGRDHHLVNPEIIGPNQALPAFPLLIRKRLAKKHELTDFVWAHRADSGSGAASLFDSQETN